MRGSTVLWVLGLLSITVGLILGLVPVTGSGGHCGSAFWPAQLHGADSVWAPYCEEALGQRRLVALLAVGPGVVLLLTGILTSGRNSQPSHA